MSQKMAPKVSRNFKKKKASKKVGGKKTTAPDRSSTITSDDDDYTALDGISDSDDEEPDVEAAEEQAIIESMARGSDDEEDADDESNDDDDAPQPDQDGDSESFNGFADEPTNEFFNEQIAPTIRRRVHFDLDEVDYSTDSGTDSENSAFPDLLAEEDLDPKFRQLVQADNGDEDDGSETFWDWDSATANYGYADADENVLMNLSDENDSSSGYSTDEGETTEEDLPSGRTIYMHPSRTVLRRENDDSTSEEEVEGTRARTKSPKIATWYNDGTQSFAMADHSSQKLMVFVAKTPQKRRHSYDSIQTSNPMATETSFTATEPFMDMSHSQMIMSTPENVMLGANWVDSSNNGFMMSPEALTGSAPYSFNSTFGQIIPGSQSSSAEDDEGVGIMGEFDFDDFVHHDSDDENEDDSSATGAETTPSTRRPSSAAMSLGSQDENYVHPLLSHFDNTNVGAFRRNQNHHRLITRNNESYESLAFSSPIHEGTLRGVKQGKLAAINTPMTPLRKSKVKAEFTFPPTSEKRKREISSEQTHSRITNSHKRTRSMA